MRYRLLLSFLAVAAVAAAADTIDYSGAGSVAKGTAKVTGSIAAGKIWEVADELTQVDDVTNGKIVNGDLGMIDVTTGTLFKCSSGLCFNGGTLDIDNLSDKDLFLSSMLSGSISQSNGFSILSATLKNGAVVTIKNPQNEFSTQAIIHAAVTPEPASLLLLGSGLVGLGFLRKSFRLGV